MPTRGEQIAWSAGLFDGEGCVAETDRRFTLRLVNTDEELVRRFHDYVGLGRIYGPYVNTCSDGYKRKLVFHSVAYGYDALDIMNLLAPFLSTRRRARAYELTGLSFPVETSI
jgi:hypothetical protein